MDCPHFVNSKLGHVSCVFPTRHENGISYDPMPLLNLPNRRFGSSCLLQCLKAGDLQRLQVGYVFLLSMGLARRFKDELKGSA